MCIHIQTSRERTGLPFNFIHMYILLLKLNDISKYHSVGYYSY